MKTMLLGLSLVLGASTIALADDTFKAEYMSGKTGFKKNFNGNLIIGAEALTMMDGKKVAFTIPITTVTKVSGKVETINQNSPFKLASDVGVVSVSTETAEAAEGIVFRVDKNVPTDVVAKIEFAMKKAKEHASPSK